ncbi:iron-containing redox enzyme family protein [Scytonema millei]|uniref:Iron-containing redox enzyme family protein n=1 Tax=Scytonema millei VB511283 TaxID=1245923 RepID=A0A9X5EAF2_9CYAN|nr:iron-containing redox enzyme family protein [Scytonema millei]NHC37898.1 iron-containing redox enzyme family protein [Scytonema millei VB511283]
MHSDIVTSSAEPKITPTLTATQYYEQAQQFIQLLEMEDLDRKLTAQPQIATEFEKAIATAIEAAYSQASSDDAAHLFLQRVLYRINRLKLFWYDDLRRYTNERSPYLSKIRDRIEAVWQQWELSQFDLVAFQGIDIRQALLDRVAVDLEPPLSDDARYFRDRVGEAGYRRLLAIASLDGLVEASQLSRTLGGVANEVHSVLTRLLVEEYGGGRLGRKHSSHFTTMLEAVEMQTQPEAYFDLVPWEVLASINHSFLLTERKRYFLRYIGGLLYGELSVPAGFRNYRAAGERLGLSANAMSYWDLHIKVDELHGRWMLDDVALPLISQYPHDAWEMVLGYDQQKFLSDRAGAAVARSVREAEQMG